MDSISRDCIKVKTNANIEKNKGKEDP